MAEADEDLPAPDDSLPYDHEGARWLRFDGSWKSVEPKDIGEHSTQGVKREKGGGFARIFGMYPLGDHPLLDLFKKVKVAFEAEQRGVTPPGVTDQVAWKAQYEILKGFVELGVDGIYSTEPKPGKESDRYITISKPAKDGVRTVRQGHHRLMALYILNQERVCAIPSLHQST